MIGVPYPIPIPIIEPSGDQQRFVSDCILFRREGGKIEKKCPFILFGKVRFHPGGRLSVMISRRSSPAAHRTFIFNSYFLRKVLGKSRNRAVRLFRRKYSNIKIISYASDEVTGNMDHAVSGNGKKRESVP